MLSHFCRTPPCGGSRPMGQQARLLVCRLPPLGVSKIAPGPAGYGRSARDGACCSGRTEDRKSEALLSAPLRSSATCPANNAAEPRGAREARCHAGCHAAPEGKRSFAADTVRSVAKNCIVLTACAGSEVRSGSRDCRAVKLLSTQIVRKQAKAISSRTTRHIACNVVVNAFQQYEWLARLATAKLERRRAILGLAHPPVCGNGANSLEIHDAALLKSRASRQEKASACNRNCAATDEHFCHDVRLRWWH